MPKAYLDYLDYHLIECQLQACDSGPPGLPDRAYHGLAGEFVRAMEPYSEANPASILVQLLVAFGNAVGRGPNFVAGADTHYTNNNAVIVGQTANARKGMSMGFVRELLARADPDWAEKRVLGGLASGEGLIAALQKSGNDKRLLAFESEFSRVLKTAERSGNTLSDIIRQAWDGSNLNVMTRQNPLFVNDPHVSVVGHITMDELISLMPDISALNGFANRFLWVYADRYQYLPEGEPPADFLMTYYADELRNSLSFGGRTGMMHRDARANALWNQVYEKLSAGRSGMIGAATARAEAHTMRLACVYALLDQSGQVQVDHLVAALAVWCYCEASARLIFGGTPGDPVTSRILALLRRSPDGMTRTELSNAFSHNRTAREIDAALKGLESQRQIEAIKETRERGRPAERWRAVRIGD